MENNIKIIKCVKIIGKENCHSAKSSVDLADQWGSSPTLLLDQKVMRIVHKAGQSSSKWSSFTQTEIFHFPENTN